MLFSDTGRNNLLKTFAALAFAAALYHIVGVIHKVNDSPAWRHLLFAGINLFCGYGFIKRPTYFTYFITALLIQQYYSHGSYLIQTWLQASKIHWISIAVLVVLPFSLICLIEDGKSKGK